MIFAFEQPQAILVVPPVWKRDEGQKKVEKKLKDKQKLEDEDATFSSARITDYF